MNPKTIAITLSERDTPLATITTALFAYKALEDAFIAGTSTPRENTSIVDVLMSLAAPVISARLALDQRPMFTDLRLKSALINSLSENEPLLRSLVALRTGSPKTPDLSILALSDFQALFTHYMTAVDTVLAFNDAEARRLESSEPLVSERVTIDGEPAIRFPPSIAAHLDLITTFPGIILIALFRPVVDETTANLPPAELELYRLGHVFAQRAASAPTLISVLSAYSDFQVSAQHIAIAQELIDPTSN